MRSSTNRRPGLRAAAAAAAAAALLPALLACASPQKRMRAEKRSGSHLALARKLMEQQRFQEALGQADLALHEMKKNADAWLVRGQVRFGLGDYGPAVEDFSRALELKPAMTEALSWRAWAHIESGDAARAEADYRTALKDRTYPTPEKLHLNLGMLLLKVGREAEAVREMERAVALNPAYARGHYELGKIKDRSGDTGSALVHFQAALGGMKDSADLNLRLAIALERTGDGVRAREHFKRVLELAPSGPEAATARDHLKRLDSPS
jgi:tetratricopeptide (TPR) repeat protein